MSAILGLLALAKYKYPLRETGISLSLSIFLGFPKLVKLDSQYYKEAASSTKNPITAPQELLTTICLTSTLQLSNARLDVHLTYHSGSRYPTLLNCPIQWCYICMRSHIVALDTVVANGEDPHTISNGPA